MFAIRPIVAPTNKVNPDDFPRMQVFCIVLDFILLIVFTCAYIIAMTLIVKRKDF